MPRSGRPDARATRSRGLTVIALGLAGLVLAGCSGSGSEGSRPTLTASLALPSATRTSDASRTSSEAATSSAPAPSPTAGAPGVGAGTQSVGRPSPPAVTTTTSEPAVTTTTTTATATRTETRTQTRTETQTVAPTTATAPAPTTAAAVPSPTPVASAGATATDAESTSSGEVPWWAWALLVLVVAGLIAGFVIMQRRRGQAVEAWDRDQADAEDAALWLHDRVLPTVLADPRPADQGLPGTPTAWSAARPRFVELDEKLSVLARSAPDEDRRAAVGTLRAALADTGLALDQRGTAPGPQAWTAAQTRAVLAADHLARVLSYDAAAAAPAVVGAGGFGDVPAAAIVPPAQRPAPAPEKLSTPTAPLGEAPDPVGPAPDPVGQAPDPVGDAPGPPGPGGIGSTGGGRHAQPRDEPHE